MRIAVAATPAIAIPALEALTSSHQIAAIFTQPDRPFGRGQQLKESDVALWAKARNIQVFKEIHHLDVLQDVDLVITIAYGVLIKKELLALPRHGFINLHYSLLPRWRGASPVQQSLLAGDEVTGVTIFQLDEGMDTGPIYIQKSLDIAPEWNAHDLFERLNQIGAQALLETILLIESGANPTPQSGEATLAPKIAKSQYVIDFHNSAEVVRNHVRALFPHSYFLIDGQRIKVLAARLYGSTQEKPGTVISLEPFAISCGDNSAIEIERILPEGKREMTSRDWLRGHARTVGERVG